MQFEPCKLYVKPLEKKVKHKSPATFPFFPLRSKYERMYGRSTGNASKKSVVIEIANTTHFIEKNMSIEAYTRSLVTIAKKFPCIP